MVTVKASALVASRNGSRLGGRERHQKYKYQIPNSLPDTQCKCKRKMQK